MGKRWGITDIILHDKGTDFILELRQKADLILKGLDGLFRALDRLGLDGEDLYVIFFLFLPRPFELGVVFYNILKMEDLQHYVFLDVYCLLLLLYNLDLAKNISVLIMGVDRGCFLQMRRQSFYFVWGKNFRFFILCVEDVFLVCFSKNRNEFGVETVLELFFLQYLDF